MKDRVLIVEDNEDIRSIYALYLRFRGYDVLEADNGYHGVEVARSERPDVIVMDLAMPVLDGLDATAVLKSDPATAGIPVVLVTAHTVIESRAQARELGFEACLCKPVTPQRLISELERILAPRARVKA